MKRVQNILHSALCLVSFFMAMQSAEAQTSSCVPGAYTVMFVNGVQNTPEDAGISIAGLEAAVEETEFKGFPIKYILAYNPTKFAAWENDFFVSIEQKAAEYGLSLKSVAPAYFLSNWVDPILRDAPDILGGIQSAVVPLYAELMKRPPLINDSDLEPLVQKANSVGLENGLLIFGHSQGSFYANQIYRRLLESNRRTEDTMAVTGAAIVANAIIGPVQGYVTSDTDELVNAVRAAVNSKAPYPSSGGPSFLRRVANLDDPIGHSFGSIYLNQSYQFREIIKKNVLAAFDGMKMNGPCKLVISVEAADANWMIAPTVELSGLNLVNKFVFSLQGTAGNTCGGERGSPLYSRDDAIAQNARVWEAPIVKNAPYQLFPGPPNRRPCSSFVAQQFVPPPNGVESPRERLFANATGRIQTFGGSNLDWEYQLRFDSGDPWLGSGKRCQIATVPGSNFFFPQVEAKCTAKFAAVNPT